MFLGEDNKGVLDYPIVPYDEYVLKLNKTYRFKPNMQRKPDFVIMVGFPGSGKSQIANYIKSEFKRFDKDAQIVSQDNLGSKARVIKTIKEYLEEEENIIVDNTNVDLATRRELTKLAKKHDYFVRIVHVDTPIDRCRHNNYYRYLKNYENSPKLVPDMAYRVMIKRYVVPSLDKDTDKNVDQIDRTQGGVPYDLEYFYFF